MLQTLSIKTSPREEFRAEILRAFLANAPAVMQYTEQYGLCPTEIIDIFHEALLHAIGNMQTSDSSLPILAKPPAELCCKTAAELQFLLGDYSAYSHIPDC